MKSNINNRDISYYVDIMVVQSLLDNPSLVKTAQGGLGAEVSSLVGKIKDYVTSKINDKDRVGSVLELLAPGALFVALQAIGIPTTILLILSVAASYFDINIGGILRSAYNSIKSALQGSQTISPTTVTSIVNDAVDSNSKSMSPEEESSIIARLSAKKSSLNVLNDARFVKLALTGYEKEITKQALPAGLLVKLLPVLKSIFGFIFKTILASAGLLVVGEATTSLLGKSPISETKQPAIPEVRSTQTKFKPTSTDYTFNGQNAIQRYYNTEQGVSQMVLDFAKESYQGLDSLNDIIKSTTGFRAVVSMILSYNQMTKGDPMVFIPNIFKSKRNMTDHFIDEVAAKSK